MGLFYRITERKSPRAERELSTRQGSGAHCRCASHLPPWAPRNKGHESTTNYKEGTSLLRELNPAQLNGKELDWIKGEEDRVSR